MASFDNALVERVIDGMVTHYKVPNRNLVRQLIYQVFYTEYQHNLVMASEGSELATVAPNEMFDFVGDWPVFCCSDPLTDFKTFIKLPILEMPNSLPDFEKNMIEHGYQATGDSYEMTWLDPLTDIPEPLYDHEWRHFLKYNVTGFNMMSHFFGQKGKEVVYSDEKLTPEIWDKIYPLLVGFKYTKDVDFGYPLGHIGYMSDYRVIIATYTPENRVIGAYLYLDMGDNHILGPTICRDFDPRFNKYSVMFGLNLALIRFNPHCTICMGSNANAKGDDHSSQDNMYKKHIKNLRSAPVHAWQPVAQ